MTDRIPALSLWRPWTTCIATLGKRVENRGWATPYRGPLYLHGALRWDEDASDYVRRLGYQVDANPAAHPSGMVAVVDLVGMCDESTTTEPCGCGPWAVPGLIHWRLDAVRVFAKPVDCKGRQGLWWPVGDLGDALADAAREAVLT